MHGSLEDEPVIAQPVAVVGEVDDDRVLGQPRLLERNEDAAEAVVDERDPTVGVGDDFP